MSGYGYTSTPQAPIMQSGGQQSSSSGGNPEMVGKIADAVAETAEKGSMLQKGAASLAKFFLFYGGETVSQIKARSNLKVTGGSDSLKTGEDKTFYNNVSIPRKKV
jgi:hypothetical protein